MKQSSSTHTSFFRRLGINLTVIQVCAVVLAGLTIYLIQARTILGSLEESSHSTANEIARVLEHPLYSLSDEIVINLADAYILSGSLSGLIVESTATGLIVDRPPKHLSSLPVIEKEISLDDLVLGRAVLFFDDSSIGILRNRLLLFGGLILLLVVTINLVAARFLLIGPLNRTVGTILRGIRKVADADYLARLEQTPFDDINVVVDAINEMAKKLIDAQRLLESRVDERTEELQKSLEELRQTQEQLIASEKMASLGSMVRGLAHELNTPLGIAITTLSYLEGLSEDGDTREERENAYSLMSRSLTKAAELVSEMRSASRELTVGTPEHLNLKEHLEGIILIEQSKLKRPDVNIVLEGSEFPFATHFSALDGVLRRLISNAAIHACVDGGEIRVQVKKLQDAALIRVSDDGPGMDYETRSKAFDPFFTTNRSKGHSGLGLFMVYTAVCYRLEGSLRIDGDDSGTSIEITIPDLDTESTRIGS